MFPAGSHLRGGHPNRQPGRDHAHHHHVLPHVLRLRQPGVRASDAAANAQLAATLQILPLVGARPAFTAADPS